jgi:DNA-binding transcriptional ArsR family regulator
VPPRPGSVKPGAALDIRTSLYHYIHMTTTMRRAPLDPRVLDDAAAMIRVLGHPDRLRIVECLEDGERTVSELQGELASAQAAVSQQLARMRAAGIVRGRRDGANVWYSIADERVVQMLNCLRNCALPGGKARGRQERM